MNFQIKTPCSENWNAMSAIEGGRFCDSCKCKVHDFADATVEEINRKYDLNNGKICGRIPNSLLVQQFQNAGIRKGYFHNLKMFCWAALFGFGASLFNIPAAGAKGMIKQVRSVMLNTDQKEASPAAEAKIKGIVRDQQTKELLPFVTVLISANDSVIKECVTDINGYYEAAVDLEKYTRVNVKAMYIAYQITIIKDVELKDNVIVDIEMRLAETIMSVGIIVDMSDPLVDPFTSGKTVKRKQYRKMPKN